MNLSPDGLARIQAREGTVLTMYRDSAGLPTIGVGHLLTKDENSSGKLTIGGVTIDWHQGLSEDQATALLGQDLDTAVHAVNLLVQVPLLQCQFDALCSFVFNVGVGAFSGSTLLRRVNAGENDVPNQLRRWTYSGGQVNPGLVKRRESEVSQWEGL